ncbi:MAG: hypothetical protein U5Q03_06320 [Bacteroidota bacterium]|nr:hypothetical protein [Bacteroidota bacterium]
MNYFKNNKILMWALIALLVINASAVGTFIYYRLADRNNLAPNNLPEAPRDFCRTACN